MFFSYLCYEVTWNMMEQTHPQLQFHLDERSPVPFGRKTKAPWHSTAPCYHWAAALGSEAVKT
jgi:hypothetical protein